MRSLRSALVLSLAACGAGGAADSGDPGTPGGNVGFGGAQDIGEFRGILERGEIPGPNTLDANGFFNEHFVEPPNITCGGPLCDARLSSAAIPHRADKRREIAVTPIDPSRTRLR